MFPRTNTRHCLHSELTLFYVIFFVMDISSNPRQNMHVSLFIRQIYTRQFAKDGIYSQCPQRRGLLLSCEIKQSFDCN